MASVASTSRPLSIVTLNRAFPSFQYCSTVASSISSTGVVRSATSSSHITSVTPGAAAISSVSSSASAMVRSTAMTRVFGIPEPNSSSMRSSATVLSASSGR